MYDHSYTIYEHSYVRKCVYKNLYTMIDIGPTMIGLFQKNPVSSLESAVVIDCDHYDRVRVNQTP